MIGGSNAGGGGGIKVLVDGSAKNKIKEITLEASFISRGAQALSQDNDVLFRKISTFENCCVKNTCKIGEEVYYLTMRSLYKINIKTLVITLLIEKKFLASEYAGAYHGSGAIIEYNGIIYIADNNFTYIYNPTDNSLTQLGYNGGLYNVGSLNSNERGGDFFKSKGELYLIQKDYNHSRITSIRKLVRDNFFQVVSTQEDIDGAECEAVFKNPNGENLLNVVGEGLYRLIDDRLVLYKPVSAKFVRYYCGAFYGVSKASNNDLIVELYKINLDDGTKEKISEIKSQYDNRPYMAWLDDTMGFIAYTDNRQFAYTAGLSVKDYRDGGFTL